MRYTTVRNRERSRRRIAIYLGLAKWVLLLVIFGAIGYSSYQSGLWLAERKLVTLREDLAGLQRLHAETERTRDDLQARLAKANDDIRGLQRRYDADVPTGAPAELLKLARDRLTGGVPAERLAEALRLASPVVPCEGRPQTKRFVLRTGPQPVADDTVSFIDGLVSLTASLASGEDPARPVTVNFTRVNGPSSTASGKLPLRHAVIVDNVEYRFTVAASDIRGYLSVTVNNCGRG